jgi:hypothetical protein
MSKSSGEAMRNYHKGSSLNIHAGRSESTVANILSALNWKHGLQQFLLLTLPPRIALQNNQTGVCTMRHGRSSKEHHRNKNTTLSFGHGLLFTFPRTLKCGSEAIETSMSWI